MKKRSTVVIGILLAAMLCGCGVPDMTAEQEARIVNYAANIALKYDCNYQNRLVDLSKYETSLPQLPEEESEAPGMDPVEDTDIVDVSGSDGTAVSMDEFYEINGLSMDYVDYQTCKTYPEDSADDLFFSLEAKAGKILLVLKFHVTNESSDSMKVNMIDLAPVLRAQINGEKTVGVMQTMLLDDLTSYVGTLEAGESVPLVVLTEIDETYEGQITQIALHMRKTSGGEGQKIILLP